MMSSETTPSQENQQDNLIPTHHNHCAEPLGQSYLSKDLCRENGIVDIPIQLRRAAILQLVPLQFASNDSPTVSLSGLRNTVEPSLGWKYAFSDLPEACINGLP